MQVINDETLGQLVWDDLAECWEGRREFAPGRTIPVSVAPDDDAALETVLARARRAFQRLQQSEPSLRQAASEVLLDLCNEEWNEGEAVSNAAFVSRMTVKEVTIESDGCAALVYDDGNLFWGHSIWVEVDEAGVFQGASIAG